MIRAFTVLVFLLMTFAMYRTSAGIDLWLTPQRKTYFSADKSHRLDVNPELGKAGHCLATLYHVGGINKQAAHHQHMCILPIKYTGGSINSLSSSI